MSNNSLAVLKDVIKDKVTIEEGHRKKMVEVVETFLKGKFIQELKKDKLFKALYQEIFHSGSFYDGVRVGNAEEFDLNVIFKLPIQSKFIGFVNKRVDQGFLKLALKKDLSHVLQPTQPLHPLIADFNRALVSQGPSDEPNVNWDYLDVDKMRQWFEGLATKALDRIRKASSNGEDTLVGMMGRLLSAATVPEGIIKVAARKSGPAFTLQVAVGVNGQRHEIDVDLVPVFSFDIQELRTHPRIGEVITRMSGRFFTVPKRSGRSNDRFANLMWRLSFPEQERKIIYNNGCLKAVIKLLKLYRDMNEVLSGISSYALKTTVMHLCHDAPTLDWNERNMAELFLNSLEKLHTFLVKGAIWHYFDHQSDLLWDMKAATKENKARWLGGQIKKLREAKDKDNCRQVWFGQFRN